MLPRCPVSAYIRKKYVVCAAFPVESSACRFLASRMGEKTGVADRDALPLVLGLEPSVCHLVLFSKPVFWIILCKVISSHWGNDCYVALY